MTSKNSINFYIFPVSFFIIFAVCLSLVISHFSWNKQSEEEMFIQIIQDHYINSLSPSCLGEVSQYISNVVVYNDQDLIENTAFQNTNPKGYCYYVCKDWFWWKLCNYEK